MRWPLARRSCCARTEPTGLPSRPWPARVPSSLVTAPPVVSFLVSNEGLQGRIWAYLNRRSEHGLGPFCSQSADPGREGLLSHTREVAGSNPAAPIRRSPQRERNCGRSVRVRGSIRVPFLRRACAIPAVARCASGRPRPYPRPRPCRIRIECRSRETIMTRSRTPASPGGAEIRP
jgi:hypothetical protein